MDDENKAQRRGFNDHALMRRVDKMIDDYAMWMVAMSVETDQGTDALWVDRMWDHARKMLPCPCCGETDCREDDDRLWIIFHLLHASGMVERRAESILNSVILPVDPAEQYQTWPDAENVTDAQIPPFSEEELAGLVHCDNCDCPMDRHVPTEAGLMCDACGSFC